MSDKCCCDDWLIKSHKGLGRLRFGMSPEDADPLNHIYGIPEIIIPQHELSTLFRQSRDVTTIFKNNQLIMIRVEWPVEELSLAGKQIGNMNGLDVVKHMAEVLDEMPIALGEDLAFPKACIYLWNFTSSWEDKVWILDEPEDSSIMWTEGPRSKTEDFSEYLSVPL